MSAPRAGLSAVPDILATIGNTPRIELARPASRSGLRDPGQAGRRQPGVALRVAAEATGPLTIVGLLADGGWKYLSAGLGSRDLADLEDELEGALLC